MGCSRKAVSYDRDELMNAMRKVDLYHDKLWSNIDLYSIEANTIIKCAEENKSKEDTIREIHIARAVKQACIDADKELEERAKLKELESKY